MVFERYELATIYAGLVLLFERSELATIYAGLVLRQRLLDTDGTPFTTALMVRVRAALDTPRALIVDGA